MNASYFQFKQFGVSQDRCAMKVGTDGVLLGAWVHVDHNPGRILDIGSGTGVIALMLAQRCPKAEIDGVELDPEAFEQCVENFEQSPWDINLFNYHISFQEFAREIEDKYDLIVSNPPFFDHPDSPDNSRKLARDKSALPLDALISGAAELLSKEGRLALVLPATEEKYLKDLFQKHNFVLLRMTKVRGNDQSQVKRILIECQKAKSENTSYDSVIDELIIERQRHTYTEQYKALVREFYLKM
jgi:tRNA1Val (adenine37-N6)-methyltransferase